MLLHGIYGNILLHANILTRNTRSVTLVTHLNPTNCKYFQLMKLNILYFKTDNDW